MVKKKKKKSQESKSVALFAALARWTDLVPDPMSAEHCTGGSGWALLSSSEPMLWSGHDTGCGVAMWSETWKYKPERFFRAYSGKLLGLRSILWVKCATLCVHKFLQVWGPRCSPPTWLSLPSAEAGKRATDPQVPFNQSRGIVLVCCRSTCFKDPLLSSSPCKNLVRVKFFGWTSGVSRCTPETPFNSSDRSSYLRLLKTSNWIFKAKMI